MRHPSSTCPVGMAVLLGLLPVISAQAQATDPQLQKILDDWKKRQSGMDSVRYEVTGHHTTLKGTRRMPGQPRGQLFPEQDVTCEIRWKVLFDFRTGRYRREVREDLYDFTLKKTSPTLRLDVFNGSVIKAGAPREQNEAVFSRQPDKHIDFVVIDGNMQGAPFAVEFMPLFFGHGIIRVTGNEVVPGKLRTQVDANHLHVHGEAIHDGRPCLVLRTQTLSLTNTSVDEFWVDLARDSAIIRYVTYAGKHPFLDIHLKYDQVSGRSLPQQWTLTHYRGTAPSLIYRMRVTKLEVNPPASAEDFEIEAKPSSRIEERTYGESPSPLVSPTASVRVFELNEAGEKKEIPDPYGRERTPQPTRWWVWVAVVGASLMVAAFAIHRRCRTSS